MKYRLTGYAGPAGRADGGSPGPARRLLPPIRAWRWSATRVDMTFCLVLPLRALTLRFARVSTDGQTAVGAAKVFWEVGVVTGVYEGESE
jgi:hypothetical protein